MRSILERGRVTSQADPGAELICIATTIQLRSWRYFIPFMMLSQRIFNQLNQAPGLVRWRVKSDLRRRRFYTFTVWKDKGSMDSFVQAHPHREAVDLTSKWGSLASAEWTGSDGDVNWNECLMRLQTPTFTYRGPGS